MKFVDRLNSIIKQYPGINKKQLQCRLSCGLGKLDKGLNELDKKIEIHTVHGVLGNPMAVFPKGKAPKVMKKLVSTKTKIMKLLKKNGPMRQSDLMKALDVDRASSVIGTIDKLIGESKIETWTRPAKGPGRYRYARIYGLTKEPNTKPKQIKMNFTPKDGLLPIAVAGAPRKQKDTPSKKSTPTPKPSNASEGVLETLVRKEVSKVNGVLDNYLSSHIKALKGLQERLK